MRKDPLPSVSSVTDVLSGELPEIVFNDPKAPGIV